ncbi:MAG: hypothetical protein MHPSP_002565, partial [Paramarteilia canceri]
MSNNLQTFENALDVLIKSPEIALDKGKVHKDVIKLFSRIDDDMDLINAYILFRDLLSDKLVLFSLLITDLSTNKDSEKKRSLDMVSFIAIILAKGMKMNSDVIKSNIINQQFLSKIEEFSVERYVTGDPIKVPDIRFNNILLKRM